LGGVAALSRQIGELLGTTGTPEREEAVSIEAGKPHERLLQLLAPHALDRIAPEALDVSDDIHIEFLPYLLRL
jgi:hypothetical protein